MQLHATIAFLTVPEIALEQDEAHELALALAEVERYYPVNPLSPKHMAVLGLVLTVSKTYGRRVPLILNTGKTGKPNGRPGQPTPSPVIKPNGNAAPVETTADASADWFEGLQAATDHKN